ncbi:MAG TPA: sugar ABC transporter substrate-binding protein [Stellaceae bacterium]|nr:sugar ABC transporter substrate-binding protein [Stellaceae bacterium]
MTNRSRPAATRRRFLQSAAAGAALVSAPGLAAGAASFDWKRFAGTGVRFLLDAHDWSTDLVPSRLSEFEKLTGIKVRWEVYPEDQFRQKLTLNLRSDPRSVDGYMSLTSWDGEAFRAAGWYEPIDKYVGSAALTNPEFDIRDFFPNTLKIATVHGTLIGIPLYPETQLLYYDKERFAQRGIAVPTTIEEFAAAAGKLHDKKADVAGYVSRGEGLQAVYTIAPFLFAEGGRWLDDKGRPLLDSAAFVKALDVYGGTLNRYGPPGIAGMTWSQATIVFAQGRSAMMTDSSNFVSTLEDPKKSKLAGKVGYAMLPKGPAGRHSTLISWALSINAKSRHKEATWYLIQWLVGKEMEGEMAKRKIPVARQSVWNGADFQKLMPKGWLDGFVGELPGAAVNQANPLVVPVPEVRDAIGKAIVSAIQGGDARAAAQQAQKEVLQILKMT